MSKPRNPWERYIAWASQYIREAQEMQLYDAFAAEIAKRFCMSFFMHHYEGFDADAFAKDCLPSKRAFGDGRGPRKSTLHSATVQGAPRKGHVG